MASTVHADRSSRLRLGIDLGGTKIEGVALATDGREVARLRIATPREDYEGTVAAVTGAVHRLEAEAGERGTVGVGMPGAVSADHGLVKNANSTWLTGRPFHRDLAAALGREVRCANDANCLALSEAVDGAGRGQGVVFAAILGTGVGAGIVAHGRLIEGRNRLAGEWGHNPLPWPRPDEYPGPSCFCGRRGCVEAWLSGPALARDHRQATGEDLDAAAVAAAADAGDAAAEATIARYLDRLARALAQVVNFVDPDVVVFGGGLSNVGRLATDVRPLLSEWVFGGEVATEIRTAVHGDASGVRGAAWLWSPTVPPPPPSV